MIIAVIITVIKKKRKASKNLDYIQKLDIYRFG